MPSPCLRMTPPRIGSLPTSLQHLLLPSISYRSLHSSPSRSNSVMKDLLKEASNERELRQAVEVIGEWMRVGKSRDRWDQAPELLDIIVDRAPSLNATNFALDIFTDLSTYDFPTVPPPRSQFRKLVRAVVHQPTILPPSTSSSSSSPFLPTSTTTSPSSSTTTTTTTTTPLLFNSPTPSHLSLQTPVPRSNLNLLRHLYPRLFEPDPYRNLLLLQGYSSLGKPEGTSWKFYLENLVTKTQSSWTRIENYVPPSSSQELLLSRSRREEAAFRASRQGGPNAHLRGGGGEEGEGGGGLAAVMHFNRQEAQDLILGVDSLRGVYEGNPSFLEAWEGGPDRVGGGLDLGRAGVQFHRERIWELLQKNIVLPTKTIRSSSTAAPPSSSSSPTLLRLSSMHHPPPLTPHLIKTYLHLPKQYHPSDPLLLLYELHLRALLLPLVGKHEFEDALKRVEKAASVKGYDSWESKVRREGGTGWITREERERMRVCLGSREVREALGERRGWWSCLDGAWMD